MIFLSRHLLRDMLFKTLLPTNLSTILRKNTFYNTDKVAINLRVGYTSAKIDAKENFWNTTTESVIKSMIHDKDDDLNSASLVDYSSFLTSADINTPTFGVALLVPSEFNSIQAALNNAFKGDTVLVEAGTYKENIIWPDVNGIKLISAGDSSNTFIDGSGTSAVLYMNPSSAAIDTTTLIKGFTFTNGGNVDFGAGMYIKGDYNRIISPKIIYSQIVKNTAKRRGGGIYLNYSNLKIMSSKISENSANEEGGGIRNSDGNVDLINVTISNNFTGEGSSNRGGGIYQQGANNTKLTNVKILNNSAGWGGGIHLKMLRQY